MKPAAWVGFLIIFAALAFGAKAFVTNLTPYVTFEQARADKGDVQVMGKLDKSSIHYDRQELSFVLISDQGDRMPVRFTAARPANFQIATQVTAIGRYDGRELDATNLLVKCPSKYQGNDTEKAYQSGAGIGKTGTPA